MTESGKPISKYDRLVLRNGANDREFAGVRDELSGALARDYSLRDNIPAAAFKNLNIDVAFSLAPAHVIVSRGVVGYFLARVLSANKGAEIYFTTDGRDPVISEKNRYIAPIDINAGTETRAVTIKAICVDNGEKSEIFTRSFVIKTRQAWKIPPQKQRFFHHSRCRRCPWRFYRNCPT